MGNSIPSERQGPPEDTNGDLPSEIVEAIVASGYERDSNGIPQPTARSMSLQNEMIAATPEHERGTVVLHPDESAELAVLLGPRRFEEYRKSPTW